QLDGQRLHPDFGGREIRTSQGNSTYHACNWRVDRRFARGFQVNASYTWSKNLDSTSEGVGSPGALTLQQTPGNNRTSVPVGQGRVKLHRVLIDYDRAQRLTIAYVWEIPGPAGGLRRRALG